jgi:tetratricopeptide (TPR) repeat protein
MKIIFMTIAVFIMISCMGFSFVSLKAGDSDSKTKKTKKSRRLNRTEAYDNIDNSMKFNLNNECLKKVNWYLKNGVLSSTDYHNIVAHIYLNDGDMDLAYREIREAISDTPFSSDAYGMLGIYFASIGNFEQAFLANDKSIALSNGSGIPYQNRSVIYCFIEDKAHFIESYMTYVNNQKQLGRFVSRAPIAMVLLIDDPASSYKQSMLEIKNIGIKDPSTQFALIPAIFSLRYLKRDKEADRLLKDVKNLKDPNHYAFMNIFKYIDGAITAQKLIEESQKKDIYKEKFYELVARTWIGVDLDQKGDIEESQKHLKWVIMNRKSVTITCYVEGIAKPLIRKQNLKMMNQQKQPKL